MKCEVKLVKNIEDTLFIKYVANILIQVSINIKISYATTLEKPYTGIHRNIQYTRIQECTGIYNIRVQYKEIPYLTISHFSCVVLI